MAEKVSKVNIEGRLYEFLAGQGVTGTCLSAADEYIKNLEGVSEGAVLVDGMILAVQFAHANTYEPSMGTFDRIRLRYGDTSLFIVDAHGIYASGSDLWGDQPQPTILGVCLGGNFYVLGSGSSGSGGGGGAVCETESTDPAKVAAFKDYVLQSGNTFQITFENANTSVSALTLDVNGTGAKPVYFNGSATSSTNYAIPAGTFICRYDGTNYYIDTGYAVTQARNAGSATTADTVSLGSTISDLNDFMQVNVTYAQCTNDRTSNMPFGEVSGTVSVRATGSYVTSGTYYATYEQIFKGATGAIYQRRGRVRFPQMSVSWQAWEKILTEADAFNSLHIAKDGSIYADGTMANYPIIKMKDNTSDVNGNGIVIGGGGATVIGGGESADTFYSGAGLSAGSEVMVVANDGGIVFASNLQDSYASRKEMTMGTDGKLSNPQGFVGNVTGNCSGSSGSCTGNAATATSATTSNYSRQGAYCTTAGGTQAKVASMTGFVLQGGVTFPITFTNSNSYNGTITLSINNTVARSIYINNNLSSSSNKTLPAGTYLCRYSNSYYWIDTEYAVTTARYANSASSASSANHIPTSKPDNNDGAIWVS